MNTPPHKIANLFMLFLLSFNFLLAILIGQLYRDLWHGTAMGGIIRSPWFLIVIQVLGLLMPMFIFGLIPRDEGLKLIKREPLGPINVLLVIVISLLLQPAMMLFSGLASLAFPNPVMPLISELAILPLPQALIIVALTPAICEELVFRGFIQSGYEKQPIVIAAIVNGLFFGMIHLNLHQFFYAFAMGIVFAYMVHITRSILSVVLAHFVVNATQYTLSYLALRQFGPPTPPTDYELQSALLEILILSGFTLPPAIGIFYIFVRYNAHRQLVGAFEENTGENIGESIEVSIEENTETNTGESTEENAKEKLPFDIAFWTVIIVFAALMVISN